MALDILPNATMNDVQDRLLGNIVFIGKSLHGDIASAVAKPNVFNSRYRQPGIAIAFTSRRFLGIGGMPMMSAGDSATLARHVSHIGEMVSEKQMCWIDATADVARMKNHFPMRNGAIDHFPEDTMCHAVPAAMTTNPDGPISIATQRSLPKPASIGLLNLVPKALFNWNLRKRHDAIIVRGRHRKVKVF